MPAAPPSATPFDLIAPHAEQLLVRYAQLQRTNALLAQQVSALAQERDALRSRLQAASSKVDALLARLPDAAMPPAEHKAHSDQPHSAAQEHRP